MQIEILITVMTIIASAFGALWLAYKDRRAVRLALLAEIQALSEVMRDRDYLGSLLESAVDIESGAVESDSIRVAVADHYRCIYDANTSKLGCLTPHETQQVVRFYQLIDAVVRDVSPGGGLYDETSHPNSFREAAGIMKKALDIADELSAKGAAKLPS